MYSVEKNTFACPVRLFPGSKTASYQSFDLWRVHEFKKKDCFSKREGKKEIFSHQELHRKKDFFSQQQLNKYTTKKSIHLSNSIQNPTKNRDDLTEGRVSWANRVTHFNRIG